MNAYDNLDSEPLADNNTPKGNAELQLLLLIQKYPEAAKYLGQGALPYLQKLSGTVADPQTLNSIKGITAGLEGSNAQ